METPKSARTPTTPKSPALQVKTFTLWCNNKRHDFDAEIFAKMSRKASILIREGQIQGIIEKRVRQETFDAFVAACQLKAFKVTATNAFELKELAVDWGVASLETFVNNYIRSKNLKPQTKVDHLGILIDHLDNGIDDPNDVLAVANFVNDALRDERFERVPPEVIFKILIASDQKRVDEKEKDPLQEETKPDHQILDQQLLIKFTLQLLKDPQLVTSAIPLTLMIDFKLLTKEQREFIFQKKEMHENNIGYFVANSMSATRNKAERELMQSEARLLSDLNALRENLKQHQRSNAAKLKKEQDESLGDLKEALLKQQETIKDLQDDGVKFETKLDEDNEEHDKRFQGMKDLLNQIDQYTSQRNSIATEKEVLIKDQVAEQLAPLKAELDDEVKKLAMDDAMQCAELEQKLMRLIEEDKKKLRQLASRVDDCTEDVDNTNVELSDIKATLAAKIVHDRLRFDKFLRKTDDRFAVFIKSESEPGVWDLAPEKVAQAEQFVIQIENIVDTNCPIRGSYKTNNSKKAEK